jgi:hypothetical protein
MKCTESINLHEYHCSIFAPNFSKWLLQFGLLTNAVSCSMVVVLLCHIGQNVMHNGGCTSAAPPYYWPKNQDDIQLPNASMTLSNAASSKVET